MNYAYVQGQELIALAYFERLLSEAREPKEREKLKRIIERLRQDIPDNADIAVASESSVYNFPGAQLR